MPYLRHPPIVLRAFEAKDVDLVVSVCDDPLIPLITTVPTSGSHADARAFLARQHDGLRMGAGYSFAIAEVGTDQAVGQIGLWTSDIIAGRTTTGYWIAPRFRRRGYVTAALAALTEWALSLKEIQRVQLHVEPWNQGSWRAAESCGYVREGLLRSWEHVGDHRRDMFIYSVVKDRTAL
jgi:RimJ/RimL family protein N-acetyltransferase